jgi:hypothetical protein
LQIPCGDLTSNLTVAANVGYRPSPRAFTLIGARAFVLMASTSGVVTVDVKVNGSSIFSTLLTIDANERSSQSAATPAALSLGSVPSDALVTVDVTTAGTGAKGLVVTLIGS